MNIFSVFLFTISFAIVTLSYGQKTEKNASYFLEQGNYKEAIDLLSKSADNDAQANNWTSWIKNKKSIGDCYAKLFEHDALKNLINNLDKIIQDKKIKNPISLSEFHELKAKMYFVYEDIDIAFKEIKKSYCFRLKSKKKSEFDFFSIYCCYTYYYNYNANKKSAYYAAKLENIITKNKGKLSNHQIADAYNLIAFSQKTQPVTGNQTEYTEIYDKSIQYSFLALEASQNIPLMKAQTLYFLGNTYARQVYDMDTYHFSFNKEKLRQKANTYFDLAIALDKKYYPKNPLLLIKMYLQKGHLNEEINPQLSLKLYNNSLQILIPDWKRPSNILLSPDTLSPIKNKPFATVVLYFKALHLSKLYEKTLDITYLKAAFNAYDFSSKIWNQILNEYDSSSPFQSLNVHEVNPFQDAIKLAYQLYEKTKNKYYKQKIIDFSESNKYSDVLKDYLQTLKKEGAKKVTQSIHSLKNLTIQQIQNKQLTNTNCVVEYTFDADGILYCALITKKSYDVIKLHITSKEIDTKIIALQTAIVKSDILAYKKQAFELYQLLFHPFINSIPKKINHLIIVPERMLSFVPFDALLTHKSTCNTKDYRKLPYLIKNYQISEQLSLTIAEHLKHKKQNTTSTNLFGLAVENVKGLNNLPFSVKCLNDFEDNYTGHFIYGSDATSANFKKYAPSSSIIFLATHAKSDLSNYENSRIYFQQSETKKEASHLHLEDIYKLKLNSELVVLSACETSLGKYQYGEGIISFERAFVFAGSKSVLSTLWQTDDQASSQLLTTFIDHLNENEPKFTALHNSKKQFLTTAKASDDANPLYWAGYKLIGSDSTVIISKSNNKKVIIVISLFLLLSGIFLYKMRKSKIN